MILEEGCLLLWLTGLDWMRRHEGHLDPPEPLELDDVDGAGLIVVEYDPEPSVVPVAAAAAVTSRWWFFISCLGIANLRRGHLADGYVPYFTPTCLWLDQCMVNCDKRFRGYVRSQAERLRMGVRAIQFAASYIRNRFFI